jgi:hypothetical protein
VGFDVEIVPGCPAALDAPTVLNATAPPAILIGRFGQFFQGGRALRSAWLSLGIFSMPNKVWQFERPRPAANIS